MTKILNYINGTLVEAKKKQWLDNYNPSLGEVYSKIPDSDGSDLDQAYKAAHAAFPSWSKTPKEERAKIMLKIASLIEERSDELS